MLSGVSESPVKPSEAENFIKAEIKKEDIRKPNNLEEKAISLIGRTLYQAFIKGYTIKHWGLTRPTYLHTSLQGFRSGLIIKLTISTTHGRVYQLRVIASYLRISFLTKTSSCISIPTFSPSATCYPVIVASCIRGDSISFLITNMACWVGVA
jgi:hypothetical protein